MKRVLDLGCGGNKLNGAIGIDSDKNSHADIIHDLNKFPYPFPKNYFDLIYCSHILEHLDDYERVLKEIHRIARRGAKVVIKVPHFSSCTAYSTRGHKHYFGCKIFREFEPEFKLEKLELRYIRLDSKRKKNVF